MKDEVFYANILQLIDHSCRRGTWNGKELPVLAKLQDHVVAKLKELNQNVPDNLQSLESEPEKVLKEK